ncbi:MAG: hypothetical protein AB7O24_02335 [Kofleriaceae bacterium]
MSDLSPATRALLDAAREGMTPSAQAVKRMRANIATSAAAGATAAGVIAKLTLLGVVVVGAISAVALRSSHPQVSAPEIALVEPPRHQLAPVIQYSLPPPASADAASADAALAKPVEDQPRSRPVPQARRPVEVDLARESSLIRQADTALRGGNPTAALSVIRSYDSETRGAGQLAEDAAAIQIEAYCQLHDARVARLLEAFDRQFPRSAQRSRLTSLCQRAE